MDTLIARLVDSKIEGITREVNKGRWIINLVDQKGRYYEIIFNEPVQVFQFNNFEDYVNDVVSVIHTSSEN